MNLLKKLSTAARYMLLSLAVLFVGFALLGSALILFIYPLEPLPRYLAGLFLGCVVTAARLCMMDYSIQKEVDMPEDKAKNYHRLMFLPRFGLLLVLVVALLVFPAVFGVWGGMLGVFCMQLSAYGANILMARRSGAGRNKVEEGSPPASPDPIGPQETEPGENM